MKKAMALSEEIYSKEELVEILKKFKADGKTRPELRFSVRYWKSLEGLSAEEKKEILKEANCKDTFAVEIDKGIPTGRDLAEESEERISYDFVPQAFLRAYVDAWKDRSRAEYLIIEEINRGNCAQIFGDLFQLLDRRDDGYSSYAIRADADLERYLRKEFEGVRGSGSGGVGDGANPPGLGGSGSGGVGEGANPPGLSDVFLGKKLLLPPNLLIRATMNTSDQSLFPIDSAFKRRWDWKYVPIENATDKQWSIVLGEEEAYDWWAFVEAVNRVILSLTSSHDKQLGFYFIKADKKDEIAAERFINKVLFYLWTDVFKDYDDSVDVLNYEKDGAHGTLQFTDFFGAEAIETLRIFFDKLGLKPIEGWVSKSSEEREDLADEPDPTTPEELSQHHKTNLAFWTAFREYAKSKGFADVFSLHSPSADNWYELTIPNKSGLYHVTMATRQSYKDVRVGFYFKTHAITDTFEGQKQLIEQALGGQSTTLTKGEKHAQMYITRATTFDQAGQAAWNETFDWMMDVARKLKDVAKLIDA